MYRYQFGWLSWFCITSSLPGAFGLLSSQKYPDDIVRRSSTVIRRLSESNPSGKPPPFIAEYTGVVTLNEDPPCPITAPAIVAVTLFAADRVSCSRSRSKP